MTLAMMQQNNPEFLETKPFKSVDNVIIFNSILPSTLNMKRTLDFRYLRALLSTRQPGPGMDAVKELWRRY